MSAEAVEAVRALARAARAMERRLDPLSMAQYRVLSAVASGDARATAVAHRLALGKPAVSAAVDGLCQRGLLERSGDASDQRVARLTLTTPGATLLSEVEARMVAELDELLDVPSERTAVLVALGRLGHALDTRADKRRGS